MTMPTLRDLAHIFTAAQLNEIGYPESAAPPNPAMYRGLRAVLDALQPVVAEAFAEGDGNYSNTDAAPSAYAARIIAKLKGESRE